MFNRWVRIVFFGFVICAQADTLHFKSGRTMQVLVDKETPEEVTFRIGASLITFPKDQISKIEYDAPEGKNELEDQWRRENFSNDLYAPEELKPLLSQYRELQSKRREMILENKKLTRLEKESAWAEEKIDPLEKKILKMRTELRSRQNEVFRLNRLRNETVLKMNSLVREANEIRGEAWSQLMDQHAVLKKQQQALSAAARRATSKYQDVEVQYDESIVEFKEARALINKVQKDVPEFQSKTGSYRKQINAFYDLLKQYDSARNKEEYTHIFEGIDKALQEMRFELQLEKVPVFRQHNTLLVDVLINGNTPAKMIFDTGASTTTISGNLADKLGIQTGEEAKQKLFLADGSMVSAHPVMLDSLKVGTAVRQNVQASILEQPPSPGVDGLLGMSFLKYFTVQFAPDRDSVELIHFEAEGDAL